MQPAAKQFSSSRLSRVGIVWALITVAIWGLWSVYTRLGLTRNLAAEDLVALRFGISGLLLLPLLFKSAKGLDRAVWTEGVLLAVCQGAPFVLLLAVGLRYAPANHAPALTTGMMPLFAGVLGFLLFGRRTDAVRAAGLLAIAAGALTLAAVNAFTRPAILIGDVLFVCASIMATIYTLRASHLKLSATQGAGIVCVYSMIGYLPAYWIFGEPQRLLQVPLSEVALQAIYQGVLMGALSMLTFNKAIELLGPVNAAAFVSLVPVVATLAAIPVLQEIPTLWDLVAIAAISGGVLVATGVFSHRPSGSGAS